MFHSYLTLKGAPRRKYTIRLMINKFQEIPNMDKDIWWSLWLNKTQIGTFWVIKHADNYCEEVFCTHVLQAISGSTLNWEKKKWLHALMLKGLVFVLFFYLLLVILCLQLMLMLHVLLVLLEWPSSHGHLW